MSDRKYRHSGYQDSGGFDKKSSRSDRPRPAPQKERLEGGPRGRTTGGFGPEAFKCNKCGALQHGLGEVTPESVCQCGADLHSCSNCKHFDTTTLWECREKIPARIASKRTRNDCALFAPKIVRDLAPGKGGSVVTPDDARSAFEKLFKK